MTQNIYALASGQAKLEEKQLTQQEVFNAMEHQNWLTIPVTQAQLKKLREKKQQILEDAQIYALQGDESKAARTLIRAKSFQEVLLMLVETPK